MRRNHFASARSISALFLAAAIFWAVQCQAAPLVHLSRAAIDFDPIGLACGPDIAITSVSSYFRSSPFGCASVLALCLSR